MASTHKTLASIKEWKGKSMKESLIISPALQAITLKSVI